VGKRRRTPAEIERIVCEFESSGLNRSQFCRRQGLTLGALNRYLQRRHAASASGDFLDIVATLFLIPEFRGKALE